MQTPTPCWTKKTSLSRLQSHSYPRKKCLRQIILHIFGNLSKLRSNNQIKRLHAPASVRHSTERVKCNLFIKWILTGWEAKRLKGCIFSPPSLAPVPGGGKEARKLNLSIASNPVSVQGGGASSRGYGLAMILTVPPSHPSAMPILPDSHLPFQNLADSGTAINKVYPT